MACQHSPPTNCDIFGATALSYFNYSQPNTGGITWSYINGVDYRSGIRAFIQNGLGACGLNARAIYVHFLCNPTAPIVPQYLVGSEPVGCNYYLNITTSLVCYPPGTIISTAPGTAAPAASSVPVLAGHSSSAVVVTPPAPSSLVQVALPHSSSAPAAPASSSAPIFYASSSAQGQGPVVSSAATPSIPSSSASSSSSVNGGCAQVSSNSVSAGSYAITFYLPLDTTRTPVQSASNILADPTFASRFVSDINADWMSHGNGDISAYLKCGSIVGGHFTPVSSRRLLQTTDTTVTYYIDGSAPGGASNIASTVANDVNSSPSTFPRTSANVGSATVTTVNTPPAGQTGGSSSSSSSLSTGAIVGIVIGVVVGVLLLCLIVAFCCFGLCASDKAKDRRSSGQMVERDRDAGVTQSNVEMQDVHESEVGQEVGEENTTEEFS